MPLSGNKRISRQKDKKGYKAFCTMINKLDLIYMNTASYNCRICMLFKYT